MLKFKCLAKKNVVGEGGLWPFKSQCQKVNHFEFPGPIIPHLKMQLKILDGLIGCGRSHGQYSITHIAVPCHIWGFWTSFEITLSLLAHTSTARFG